MLKNIQSLRGIACLLVLLAHAWNVVPGPGGLPVSVLLFFAFVGAHGVDLFFVISGFVIALAIQSSAETNSFVAGQDFSIRRFMRIYPTYWVVFILSFAFVCWTKTGLWHAAPWAPMSTPAVLQRAMLLDPYNIYVPQAWTLSFEAYFYAVVAVCLVLTKTKRLHLLGAWAVVTLGVIVLSRTIVSSLGAWWLVTNPLVMEFMFGVAVAYLFRHRLLFAPVLSTALGVTLCAIAAALQVHKSGHLDLAVRAATAGLGSAALVYGLLGVEVRSRWTLPVALQNVGAASYSIYLWHMLVLGVLVRLLPQGDAGGLILPLARYAAFCGISVAVGLVSYKFLELPSIAAGKAMVAALRRARSVRISGLQPASYPISPAIVALPGA